MSSLSSKSVYIQMLYTVNFSSNSAVALELKQLFFIMTSSKNIFNWPFQGGASFVDHFCFLCFVFVMLSCLFIATLWSPAGKGLVTWLSCMLCFIVFLSLSHVVSWVRCATKSYRFLIFASLLLLLLTRCLCRTYCINVFCLSLCQSIYLSFHQTLTSSYEGTIYWYQVECKNYPSWLIKVSRQWWSQRGLRGFARTPSLPPPPLLFKYPL